MNTKRKNQLEKLGGKLYETIYRTEFNWVTRLE